MSKGNTVPRRFHTHETARTAALDGLPLATFWQRALGYVVDLLLALAIWGPIELAWRYYVLRESDIQLTWDFHEVGNLIVMVLYWGAANYFGNGRTPGKWVARTRALSLTSERLGLWQALERSLGYGAAILEGGLRAVLLGPKPDVRTGSASRNDCGGRAEDEKQRAGYQSMTDSDWSQA